MQAWCHDFDARVAAQHAKIYPLALAFDHLLGEARAALRTYCDACEATHDLMREAGEYRYTHQAKALAENAILAGQHPSFAPCTTAKDIRRDDRGAVLFLRYQDGGYPARSTTLPIWYATRHRVTM